MAGVLVAEDGLGGGDAPVDAKGVVEDADASVGLRMAELIALVLEDGSLAEYGEAMGEALRDEELAVVVFGEFYGNVLAVGRGAFTNVNGYVQDGTFDTANEFALCEGGGVGNADHASRRKWICFHYPGRRRSFRFFHRIPAERRIRRNSRAHLQRYGAL